MARIKPFQAIRPNENFSKEVIALPYDVIDVIESRELAKGNPYSFLHISRSEIDLPEDVNVYSDQVYTMGKKNLDKFLDEKILLKEKEDCLYIYKQKMGNNIQTGIVACVSVDDYIDDVVKKHELTRVEKERDRTKHFDTINAQTEPIFLTYKDEGKIKKIINEYIINKEPLYDISLEDGIQHVLWKLEDEKIIEKLINLFKEKNLYIADGHHRTASVCNVCQKRREENAESFTGKENYNYFMATIFPDSDLKIYDYNRVVQDLNGLSPTEFIDKIKNTGIEINEVKKPYKPSKKNRFGLLLEGTWYELVINENLIPSNPVDSLDVSLLQNLILEPILGIKDPRQDKRIDFVGGIRGLEGLIERVNNDMKLAFSTYPVDIKDLINVSDSGLIMPPKSTWFEPKIGSGLFIYEL